MVYSKILDVLENVFYENSHNAKGEKVSFFCLPVVTGKTISNILFPQLPAEKGRLISFSIGLEDFFNLEIGLKLIAHEAGHYLISGNRKVRNRLFLDIVCKKLAYILALNILWLPETEFDKEISTIVNKELFTPTQSMISNWLRDNAMNYINCKTESLCLPLEAFIYNLSEFFFDVKTNYDVNYLGKMNKFVEELGSKIIKRYDDTISHLVKLREKKQNQNKQYFNKVIRILSFNIHNSGFAENTRTNKKAMVAFFRNTLSDRRPISFLREENNESGEILTRQWKFSDWVRDEICFSGELFTEVKADYFMIQFLKLNKSEYETLMTQSFAFKYSLSENPDTRDQFINRKKIIELTNCFSDSGINNNDSQKTSKKKRDEKRPNFLIADYLKNYTSKVMVKIFENENINIITNAYKDIKECDKEATIECDAQFINSILNLIEDDDE